MKETETEHVSYFTFGQAHRHEINGFVFDKDVIVKITGEANPRKVMFEVFGNKWCWEYVDKPPTLSLFPKGVVELADVLLKWEGKL